MQNALLLVAFDLDGVILDSEPIHAASISRVLARYNITYDAMQNVGMSSEEMWREIIARHGLDATPAEMVERVTDEDERFMREHPTPPAPGLLPLLERLEARGVRKCVASSSGRRFVRGALRYLGIEGRFDPIVSGEMAPRKKPWPDLYRLALTLAGVPAGRAAAIEDSSSGVRAAKAAGLYCIGLRNAGSGEQDLSAADRVAGSLDEAREILLGE